VSSLRRSPANSRRARDKPLRHQDTFFQLSAKIWFLKIASIAERGRYTQETGDSQCIGAGIGIGVGIENHRFDTGPNTDSGGGRDFCQTLSA